jgi:acyl dehydratase
VPEHWRRLRNEADIAYDEIVTTNLDSSTSAEAPWSIVARNLPEHANNSIHTDEGARAAGFERALVAGVTSYAYCLHPVIEHFGLGWLGSGEAEVRFRSPVFDGDLVTFPLKPLSGNENSGDSDSDSDSGNDQGVEVEAWAARSARPLVTVSAWAKHREAPYPARTARAGEQLETVHLRLEGEYGSQYAQRSGNLEDQCANAGLVHPGVWPSLGNYVFHRQLVRGSWIHTRSIVRQFVAVADGAEAEISTKVIERFQRGGERAIADVVISVEGRVVAAIEHEAIIDLGGR